MFEIKVFMDTANKQREDLTAGGIATALPG
jgi:hypothetical protein